MQRQNINDEIHEKLFSLQDLKYREFSLKLIPGVAPETVIGVRTPELRKYSGEVFKRPDKSEFLRTFPHKYYEENNLHGFLIERIKDFDECIRELNLFLPYVDNWATCDLISPKIFKKHKEELLREVKKWIKSKHTYTVRFGIGMLMRFPPDEDFKEEYLELVAGISSDEYYINMMIAWFFATALAKRYENALPYIEEKRLSKWVHNKSIQKALESLRVPKERKDYLGTLKVK